VAVVVHVENRMNAIDIEQKFGRWSGELFLFHVGAVIHLRDECEKDGCSWCAEQSIYESKIKLAKQEELNACLQIIEDELSVLKYIDNGMPTSDFNLVQSLTMIKNKIIKLSKSKKVIK